jgi:anaerobic dimethyl sulfoxide reductase subunit A
MGTNLIKVHIKDGVMTRAEPDWADIHPNSPIEDAGISKDELMSGNFQPRGCQMAYAIQSGLYAPDRLLYPMMRTSDSARGDLNGKFVRVTWDQALDAIAAKAKAVGEKYGRNSVFTQAVLVNTTPNWIADPPMDTTSNVFRYLPYGVATWGHCSGGNEDLAGWQIHGDVGGRFIGELGNVLNTKFIVFWGNDPAETGSIPWQNASYYFHLAHEMGAPAIYIGPRESMTAEVHADQWIPIRPGTDITMMLAVANVLFKENIYDRDFTAKWIEPTGFQKWKDYVLGNTAGPDGKVDRTPEWAAPICGVPADTIRAFAHLYASYQGHANGKPCWMMYASGAARTYRGENPVRACAYLQWMTGNIGISGGNLSYCHYSEYGFNTSGHGGPGLNYNRTPPEKTPAGKAGTSFASPAYIKEWKWQDAVLLRPKLEAGLITLAEYNRIIGSSATNPAPNLKFVMIWGQSGQALTITGQPAINKVLQAIKAIEMYVWGGWHWTAEAKAADIVLPFADFFEVEGGFPTLNMSLGIAANPKLLEPQGEARPMEWVRSELAKRFGVLEYYNPYYVGKTWADWDAVDQQALQTGFTAWNVKATSDAWGGITLPSTLAELKSKQVMYAPSKTVTTTGVLYKSTIDQGAPLPTPSGKAEFYSDYYADPNLPKKKWGGPIAPMAIYEVQPYGFWDPTQNKYPLALIECHPRARGNIASCDSNPLAGKNEIFRHSVWINPVDAASRGIVDNDNVIVYNDNGRMVLPAYVTSRIVPGAVHIFAGAWFSPDVTGTDKRGANGVLYNDDYAPVMQPYNARVEVAKA